MSLAAAEPVYKKLYSLITIYMLVTLYTIKLDIDPWTKLEIHLRRVRGRNLLNWLAAMKFLRVRASQLSDPFAESQRNLRYCSGFAASEKQSC